MQIGYDEEIELETKSATMAAIAAAADEAFVGHELLKLDNRVWACANPGSGFYSFYVAELPCAIALWGDIESMLVDAGKAYNLDWLCNAVKSPNYLLEKCSLAKKTYFYSGEFKRYVLDHEGRGLLVGNDWSESAYYDYRNKTGDCDSADVVYGYQRSVLWSLNGFKKFVQLLNRS